MDTKPVEVKENVVVTMDYELTVDGEIVDSSEHGEPIIFLQGAGQIIPGLEKAINKMKIGDSKTVVVSPAEGYGELETDAIVEVPRDEFPEDFPLEIGLEITVQNEFEDDEDDEDYEDEDYDDDEVDMMEAVIKDFNDESVTLDFNHPLAGKELHFNVKIIDLREATEEELEHGHVHDDDEFHFEFDDEDFEEESDNNKH